MASIKFSRKEFEKHIKLTKEIEERISMMGTHLESVSDNEIEIEVMPNRPDLFSLQAFIRALKAFLGKKTGLISYKTKAPEKNYEVIVDKSVAEIRPHTACAIVKNLSFDDEKIKEIIDIQEKIHATFGRNRKKIAIGIYPLEKITLPIKFEARKPEDIKFIPLESDREMTGNQILRQHPTGREYAHLLQDKEKYPIFIDSSNNILSMPPIINSELTGKITKETKNIFIECSGFDFQALNKILNILVTMLADMGGEIYQMRVNKTLTPNLEPEKMKLSIENVNKLLGLNMKEKEIKKLLWRMGYDYSKGLVYIPQYRTDILHEVDLIEDIAIAYGYDNFKPEIPKISSIGEENKKEIDYRKIREILAGLGMLETLSLHLITKENLKKIKTQAIEVKDSKTDFKFLRPSLLLSGLITLSENVDCEYPQKIFEIGEVFSLDESQETKIKETDKLSILLTPSNFTEIKQILDYLGRMLDLKIETEETKNDLFIEGRTAKIKINGRESGVMGEIHPSILKAFHLKLPLAALELDLGSF